MHLEKRALLDTKQISHRKKNEGQREWKKIESKHLDIKIKVKYMF